MTEAAEFQQAVNELEESLKNGLKAFAQWFEREWQHKGREEWEKSYSEPYPGDEYIEGYNAGVRSVRIALDCFLDDLY